MKSSPQRALCRFLIDRLTDPVAVLSASGELLGLANGASLPFDLEELFAPDRRPREVEQLLRRLREEGRGVAAVVQGERRLELDGAVVGSARVVQVRDVTEQRALEDELRALRRVETIGLAAAYLAHDFNNILTPVLYLSGQLARAARGTTTEPLAAELEACAESAAALARDLLELARPQPQGRAVVDPGQAVLELRRVIERIAGDRIEVSISAKREQGLVLVDRGELERAILNLVANARDAMPRGGHLSISVAPAGEGLVALTVGDDGDGMSAEVEARAFDTFFTTRPSGSGLGLASVRRFAQESGGRVELATRRGEGTRVTIHLPYVAGEREPLTNRAPTILVVDRSEQVRRELATLLERAGFSVLDAGSVDDAVAAAIASEVEIDLAVIEEGLDRAGRLLELLRAARHHARVVWTRSGRGGALEVRTERPHERFQRRDLLTVVRATLDEPAGPRSNGANAQRPRERRVDSQRRR